MGRPKPSKPREIGVNIKTTEDWDGPSADQLALTTFSDITRATDAKRFSVPPGKRESRDKEVRLDTHWRPSVFDLLHARKALDDDQLNAVHEFMQVYAGSIGKAGQRDNEGRYIFVDYREAMTQEAAYDRTKRDRDRRDAFKIAMGQKPFNLLQSLAIDWIMDNATPWTQRVKHIYPASQRYTASTYVSIACDAVLDAKARGV